MTATRRVKLFVGLLLRLVVFTLTVVLSDKNRQVDSQAQPVPHPQEDVMPPVAQPTAPWYETLPAVAMDYKVIIDPGKEDCYFQFVNPGATFYASAQVQYYTARDIISSVTMQCVNLTERSVHYDHRY